MTETQRNEQKHQIETIFNLVEQFKESYYQEKHEKAKVESEEIEESEHKPNLQSLTHPIITSEFKALSKNVNIIISLAREEDSGHNLSSRYDSGEKDKLTLDERFLS